MKKITNKSIIKKVSIMTFIILVCSFFILTVFSGNVYARRKPARDIYHEDKDENKSLFSSINELFCGIGDLIISGLQGMIVGVEEIYTTGEGYTLKYSPGIIFSGELPAFDINFIRPQENQERYAIIEDKYINIRKTATTSFYQDDGKVMIIYKNDNSESSMKDLYNSMRELIKNPTTIPQENKVYKKGEHIINKEEAISYIYNLQEQYGFYTETATNQKENASINFTENMQEYSYWFTERDGSTYRYVVYVAHESHETNNSVTQIYCIKLRQMKVEKQATWESIARILRSIIASWYKAMREIALVGLMSVLVYVAIRGIISSSTTDKAKYKKMLFDWFTAVVIILILHYIISFTLAITASISDIFTAKIVDENGNDVVFSKLRQDVETGSFFKMVMYYCLVIMTIKYTIQYFKRFIYVAFLTMIGPIIGLTYPLDKIKDGQAQAFGLWIREFLFYALIQPFHLALYYVFVGSSVIGSFANDNPIFALAVLSFMTPAEKLLKKMFGFDKGGGLGSFEAAFGGATVMNMINQMGGKKASSNKGGAKPEGGDNRENTKVRMADNITGNPYEALTKENENNARGESPLINGEQQETEQQEVEKRRIAQARVANRRRAQLNAKRNRGAQEAEEQRRVTLGRTRVGTSINSGASIDTNTSTTSNVRVNTSTSETKNGKTNKSSLGTSLSNIKNKTLEIYNKPTIRGTMAVGGKVFKSVAKGTLKGALRLGGAATLGTIGLAAGIATGDFGKAIGGAIGGITAGNAVGKNIYNTGSRIGRGINRFGDDLTYTFEEGKYGTQTAELNKKAREFRKTNDYKQLLEKFPESKDKIEKLVKAGIYDASKIRKVIKNSEKYSVDNGIAYIHMANLCPDDIFEDRDKFKEYLANHGISEDKAEEIYKAVKEYK